MCCFLSSCAVFLSSRAVFRSHVLYFVLTRSISSACGPWFARMRSFSPGSSSVPARRPRFAESRSKLSVFDRFSRVVPFLPLHLDLSPPCFHLSPYDCARFCSCKFRHIVFLPKICPIAGPPCSFSYPPRAGPLFSAVGVGLRDEPTGVGTLRGVGTLPTRRVWPSVRQPYRKSHGRNMFLIVCKSWRGASMVPDPSSILPGCVSSTPPDSGLRLRGQCTFRCFCSPRFRRRDEFCLDFVHHSPPPVVWHF